MAPSGNITTVDELPPELLELVLLYLDMKDLLRCLRVCQEWNLQIVESSKLQQALFLKPMESTGKDPDPKLNPLLLKVFPAILGSIGQGKTTNQLIEGLPWAQVPEWSNAIAWPTASWRRMYTEQPPRHHIFKTSRSEGTYASKTMDDIFSFVIKNIFWLDGDTVFDTLVQKELRDHRVYRIYEENQGEKLASMEKFNRIRAACMNK